METALLSIADILPSITTAVSLRGEVLSVVGAVAEAHSEAAGATRRVAVVTLGDGTGTVQFAARDSQVELCAAGAKLRLTNCRVVLRLGRVTLETGLWGSVAEHVP